MITMHEVKDKFKKGNLSPWSRSWSDYIGQPGAAGSARAMADARRDGEAIAAEGNDRSHHGRATSIRFDFKRLQGEAIKNIPLLPVIAACSMLALTSIHHFRTFGTLAESLCLCLAFSACAIAWHTRQTVASKQLLFLTAAFLTAGAIGMVQSSFHGKGGSGYPADMDRALEYVCLLIPLAACFLYWRERRRLNPDDLPYIFASAVATAFSEVSLTLSAAPEGFAFASGYMLKITAFYCLHRAVFIACIKRPYQATLDALKVNEASLLQTRCQLETRVHERTSELEKSNEGLEERVRKRTMELEEANRRLRWEISERKATEDLLRLSRERYRAVVDDQTELICRFLPDTTIIFVNDSFCRGFKTDRGDCIGQLFLTFLPSEARTKLMEFLADFSPGSTIKILEYQTTSPCGEVKWQRWTSRAFFDAGGLREFQAVGQDITERKRNELALQDARRELEKRLKEQEEQITTTQETLSQEICGRMEAEQALSRRQLALEAVYSMATAFSPSMESMYDQIVLSISSILKTPLSVIFNLQDGRITTVSKFFNGTLHKNGENEFPCSLCKLVVVEKKPRQIAGNLAMLFPGGACFRCGPLRSYVGVPIIAANGQIKGILCTMDFKERVFDEYEIRLMEIFSRYIAFEISRREMEAELRQSQEMKMLGQLTSGVAHEVRNPLNGIIAIVEALFQDIGDNPDYQPYLKHIKNQVHRLSSLMEDLLMLGRPIKREHFYSVPVADFVADAFSSWRQSQHAQRAELSLIMPPDIDDWTINVDGTKAQQVFINLLDNAVQHTSEHGTIQMVVLPPQNGMVRIRVIDSGSGVLPEHLPYIFDPFFTTRKSGTGLGLSIVKHIVESHGGRITVSNNAPPPGFTVEVRFPVANQTGVPTADS